MKILFCTDGSEASLLAIKKAFFLSKKSVVDIISVVDWGNTPIYVDFPQELREGFVEQKNRAGQVLEDSKNLIELEGFETGELFLQEGNPSQIILDKILTEDYNLVVLGSHGKKGFKNWLGSVSRKIVSKSPVPIFVVRPLLEEQKEKLINKKNVLLAVDGTENSNYSLYNVSDILDIKETNCEVLTVISGAEYLPVEIVADEKWLKKVLILQKERAEEILSDAANYLQKKGIENVKKTVLEGNPAENIIKYYELNKKDIIVMGSHGREGVADFVLGSISKRVLDNVHGAILIIPKKLKKEV